MSTHAVWTDLSETPQRNVRQIYLVRKKKFHLSFSFMKYYSVGFNATFMLYRLRISRIIEEKNNTGHFLFLKILITHKLTQSIIKYRFEYFNTVYSWMRKLKLRLGSTVPHLWPGPFADLLSPPRRSTRKCAQSVSHALSLRLRSYTPNLTPAIIRPAE